MVKEKTIVRWEETSDYPIRTVTAEVTVAPVLDDNGNCAHLVVSAHDITERKQAQQALRASEKNGEPSSKRLRWAFSNPQSAGGF